MQDTLKTLAFNYPLAGYFLSMVGLVPRASFDAVDYRQYVISRCYKAIVYGQPIDCPLDLVEKYTRQLIQEHPGGIWKNEDVDAGALFHELGVVLKTISGGDLVVGLTIINK